MTTIVLMFTPDCTYTDDNAERSFEEFYEDVHTEFLKFGELVNFKVCKNASSHLRGNVYVHYKFLESAMFAYQTMNGRYFAGKQLSGEFVNLTKWKVAICGEYMKSRLKTCSRGSVCNFIHCFRNPGGDYEWADWDKPAPRYWLKEMGVLFGYTDDRFKDENLCYHLKRSRSRGPGSPHRKTHSDEDDDHRRRCLERHRGDYEENISSFGNYRTKRKRSDSVDGSDCSSEEQKSCQNSNSKRERHLKLERQVRMNREHRANASDTESRKREAVDRSLERKSRTSSRQNHDFESVHEHHRCEKSNEFDLKKSPHVERHLRKYHNHESVDSLQKTKEAFSADNVSARDSLVRDKNTRHSAKSLHMKDEGYLSDNNSNGSRFGADVRPPKSRRNISTSNNKSEYEECNSKSDSLERVEDTKCHNHGNSSRAMKNISNSALDGGRIETDGKRPQRNRRKNKRSENQADFMDSESERLKERSDGRRRRSTKKRRQVNHEAESSDIGYDGGTPQRYEKKPNKDRRIRSRSKNDLDFLDVQSSLRSLNGEERHNGYGERNNMLHMEHGSSFKPPGASTHRRDKRISDVALGRSLSEQDKIVDANCRSGAQSGRPYLTNPELQDPSPSRCSAESHDSYLGGLESTRDKKCKDTDKEHTPPINKSNVETTTSQRVEAYFRNSSCHSLDGEAEAGLELTYRMAALKKLEEMRRCKDTLPVQSRKLNISVETLSHENLTIEDVEGSKEREEISASREVGTSVASVRRKRI